MTFLPFRRFLGLPALVWVILPFVLFGIALALGRPKELSEPPVASAILGKACALVAARDGDSFRLVPQEDRDKPTLLLWGVGRTTSEKHTVEQTFGWSDGRPQLGFWKRSGRWTYELFVYGFNHPGKARSAEDVQRLRPLLVAELNRRSPDERPGDQLDELLNHGIEETSYWCVQNAVIFFVWLSLPIAMCACVAMFIRPRPVPRPVEANRPTSPDQRD
jgi:hypothetical protein